MKTGAAEAHALESASYRARLSHLKPIGDFRRFVVSRMGSTGSSWLSTLLNAHPDVFCSQEAVTMRVFPATDVRADDVLTFLEFLAWDTKHYAYKAVGDVGSVWASQLAFLPFTTALLVRHPARLLATRLTVYPEDQSFTGVDPHGRDAILERWGIDINVQKPIDRIFLHDCFIYDAQLRCIDANTRVIRLEDLQDRGQCQDTLAYLTGLHYERALIEKAIGRRVNRRGKGPDEIAGVVSMFSDQQRKWYLAMIADAAAAFGYDPLSERSP